MNTEIKFGTGGWRSVVGDDFIRENIMRVAYGVAKLAQMENKTDKPIMIGWDRRFLSYDASRWVAEVLCHEGLNVWMMARSAPTPLVMHTVLDQKLHYGLEITASHNPPKYNGIKLITEEGRDASVETTSLLEKLIADAPQTVAYTPYAECEEKELATYPHKPFDRFMDSIISKLDMDMIRDKGPRILFDPMHGSGVYPIMTILYTARCTIDLMNGEKDAYFGGSNPAPSSEALQNLINRVKKEKYDLGIAVDGDGDRLGIVDSEGNYLDANQILVMLYYYLHEYKGWKGPVVRNLATTHMLDVIAEDLSEKCYEVPVGFKYISSKIDEVDAVLGGESSGGLTVRGHIHGKDSIYASSLFVEMFSAIGKSPSAFYRDLQKKYGVFEMVEDNLRFDASAKDAINTLLYDRTVIPAFDSEILRVNYEDGVKYYFKDRSFVIARFSGTEPLLRIFAEAGRAEKAGSYIRTVKNLLENSVGKVFE